MAWTRTSDIMSGTPSVAEYAEFLAEAYGEILAEATQSAATLLQATARARARQSPSWAGLEESVEVFADHGDIVLGTLDETIAMQMRTIEYGTGVEPPAPVLRTTMTTMLTPMGQEMQRVIDGYT